MAQWKNTQQLAATLIVFCMLVISFSDNLLPLITDNFGLWEFHAIRSLIACSLFVAVGLIKKWRFRPLNSGAIFLRSLFYTTGMMLYFAALGFIPVAQAGAGLFTAPIFVLLFSTVAFGTKIGIWRISAVCIGFAGVLMVLQPNADGFSWYSLLPLFGGASYAMGLLMTQHKCANESAPALVFWFLVMAGICGVLGASYFHWVAPVPSSSETFLTRGWNAPTALFYYTTIFMAVITMIAISAQAKGYQMAEASYLAVFEYAFLISAAFWGWVIWGHTLDIISLLGILSIIAAGAIIALRSND